MLRPQKRKTAIQLRIELIVVARPVIVALAAGVIVVALIVAIASHDSSRVIVATTVGHTPPQDPQAPGGGGIAPRVALTTQAIFEFRQAAGKSAGCALLEIFLVVAGPRCWQS